MEEQRAKNSKDNLKKKMKLTPPNTYYNAVIIMAMQYL